MIKCLRDDASFGSKDNVVMVGTVIQRVIADPRIVFDAGKQVFRFAFELDEADKQSYDGCALTPTSAISTQPDRYCGDPQPPPSNFQPLTSPPKKCTLRPHCNGATNAARCF